jgi:hypothetical protein
MKNPGIMKGNGNVWKWTTTVMGSAVLASAAIWVNVLNVMATKEDLSELVRDLKLKEAATKDDVRQAIKDTALNRVEVDRIIQDSSPWARERNAVQDAVSRLTTITERHSADIGGLKIDFVTIKASQESLKAGQDGMTRKLDELISVKRREN